MARDYSKKKVLKRKPSATSNASVKKSTGGLIYAAVGLVVGLFVAFLVFLEEQPDKNTKSLAHPSSKQIQTKKLQKKSSSKRKKTVKKTSSSSNKKAKKKPNKKIAPKRVVPEYEFYTMLPDVEVEVDVPDLALKPKSKAKESKSKKYSDTKKAANNKAYPTSKKKQALKKFYQLQVGAFSAKSKADSMKAQLAFMGVQSTVYNGKLSNGKKVYKVKIGPSSDENKLKVVKAKLKRMHINTFLQKL